MDMADKITELTDVEELLDAITALADERMRLDRIIKEQSLRAIELGARRYSTSAAAAVSRPTLNAWIDAGREGVRTSR